MRAMVLDSPQQPLELRELPRPKPGPGQLSVRVSTCAVCRTDLHVVDGELPNPKLPLLPGPQIVGRVEEACPEIRSTFNIRHASFATVRRVGIPRHGSADGERVCCRSYEA